MESADETRYRALAEAAWRWVLEHVAWDDGPWVPVIVPVGGDWRGQGPPRWRDGMHEGIGGLAHTLAEVRLTRAWTPEEGALADAIVERLAGQVPARTDYTYFDGLASDVGVFVALGAADRAALACERLMELARPDGWPQVTYGADRVRPDGRINDATLGTAGVLLAALWARRHGAANAEVVARHAARVLVAEAEPRPAGATWPFIPRRFQVAEGPEMPNWSHGVAGIAAALALAGAELGRPDLTAAATAGAEHLVTLGDRSNDGFLVPMCCPDDDPGPDSVAYGWCHGPTGTSRLFLALERAGVAEVAGEPPSSWHRRCLRTVRRSGIPDRRRRGFWDNDGRCCGTAGVGDVVLDSWCREADGENLGFAVRLGDALVEHAFVEPAVVENPGDAPSARAGNRVGGQDRAYWRFVEHRNAEPLLPPGVGWMQGAAGIAAYLFRLGRTLEAPSDIRAVGRMDSWWALPEASGSTVAG